MNIASPKQSHFSTAARRGELPLPSSRLISWADLGLKRPIAKPPNWYFVLGVAAMLLLSALCWAGFAHVLHRWLN
jgi:hypothetical protein